MKKHILIFGPDPGFRFIAGMNLMAAGYKITEARNGLEALECMLIKKRVSNQVDLLLVDLYSPAWLVGLITKKIRENGIFIPVLALSFIEVSGSWGASLKYNLPWLYSKSVNPLLFVKKIEDLLKKEKPSAYFYKSKYK